MNRHLLFYGMHRTRPKEPQVVVQGTPEGKLIHPPRTPVVLSVLGP